MADDYFRQWYQAVHFLRNLLLKIPAKKLIAAHVSTLEYVVPLSLRDNVVQNDVRDPGHDYITYAYRTEHPVLQLLPTKLAEWIRSNRVGDPPEAGQPVDSIRAECNHHCKSR